MEGWEVFVLFMAMIVFICLGVYAYNMYRGYNIAGSKTNVNTNRNIVDDITHTITGGFKW